MTLPLDYYRKLVGGVAVVTACGPTHWSGTTVSTVTSVSADPPIVLCCFALTSNTLAAVRHARRFAVHLLSAGQSDVAELFSRPGTSSATRFAALREEVTVVGGAPVISGALAVAWCDLRSADEVGDHVVVYGAVAAVDVGSGSPLLWHEREYRALEGVRT